MAWTFCTSGSAVAKAGTHCDAVSGSAVTMAEWSNEAEGAICTLTNSDFLAYYSTLNAQIKTALADVASSYIAMSLVQYNPQGYLGREADMIMNRNYDIIKTGLSKLDGKSNTLKTP